MNTKKTKYKATRIVTEHIKYFKNKTTGYFKLDDGSKTQFEITKDYGWQQWGNFRQNLFITVDRLGELEALLLNI